jgi:hypothetical protein
MNAGLDSDVVVKLLPRNETYVLSFHRNLDHQVYELALRRPEDRASSLKKNLPNRLDELRQYIGLKQMKLDEARVIRAVNCLNRLAYGFLDVLLEESGQRAGEVMPQLAQFLLPVFISTALRASVPVVEIEAAASDRLAWMLPFEFLPLAPEATAVIVARDHLEPFLGFRAEIVRFLRGGADEINTDVRGRVPVHLFAYSGQETPGISEQLMFLHENTAIASIWPGQQSVPDAFTGVQQLAQHLISLPSPARERAISCIAHFSCHFLSAGPNTQGGFTAQSGFDFGQCSDGSDLTIGVFDLRGELEFQQVSRARAQFAALFFLNACQTAAASNYDETLLGLFFSHNATAIIGSETLLPDRLAAEFAINFYTEFLRDAPLSKAVFKARRWLVEHFDNPAGLLYTFYGNPMLRLCQP